MVKENKKFTYSQLKKGARSKDFEEAIAWLTNAGLIKQVYKINKPSIPLKAYINNDMFKLYMLDVGLLNCMAEVGAQILLQKNQILIEYKGALTEQYVCQAMYQKHKLYYWAAENGTAEVDFVIQTNEKIVPIEVKAELNLKAKSLKVFEDKYNTKNAIRISMNTYKKEEWIENIPLYAAEII